MKYIVEIKYTNPSHEHVTLRRRVDTVTRVVEARSENEAINRIANQQRSLGFMIKEVKIVKNEKQQLVEEPATATTEVEVAKEVEQVNEADRELNVMRAVTKHIGSKDVDQDKRVAGYKMSPTVRAAQKKSDMLSKVVKRPQAGTLAAAKMKEEVTAEAVDPGKVRVVNKKVEAQAAVNTKKTEKKTKAVAIALKTAKGKKNPVNVKPMLDTTKV